MITQTPERAVEQKISISSSSQFYNAENAPSIQTSIVQEGKNETIQDRKSTVSISSNSLEPEKILDFSQDQIIHSARKRKNNNLMFATLSQSTNFEKIKNLVKFVILKIIIPLFSFTILSVLLLHLHILINDYCFYPDLCECRDLLIFFYTIILEVLHIHAAILIIFYYCMTFITHNFYQKKGLKSIYLVFTFFMFVASNFDIYSYRHQQIENDLIIFLGLIFSGFNLFFLLFTGLIYKKITPEFLKRLGLVIILVFSLFFHRFYVKNELMFSLLMQIQAYFDQNLSLNLFKVFLMFYYIIYGYLSKKLLFHFFTRIQQDKNLSYNIIIVALKFVSMDVYSVKSLNALTIPLTEVYSWIFFLFYFYSIFSTYLRIDFLSNFCAFLYNKINSQKQNVENKKKMPSNFQKFEDFRSGCIFETNLMDID